MNKEKMIELVKVAINDVLNDEDKSITVSTKLFEDLDLDSTSIIELLMALEDNIPELSIDPEDLRAEHFESVNTLADYALNHMGEKVY
jgi:acyl carrier protein